MSTKTEPKYAVGDEVIVTSNYRGERTGVVRKVGRTLVHVECSYWSGTTEGFRMETGVMNDGYGHYRIWTMPEWEDRLRRGEVTRRLYALGVQFKPGVERTLSVAALTQVAEVLEADRGGE